MKINPKSIPNSKSPSSSIRVWGAMLALASFFAGRVLRVAGQQQEGGVDRVQSDAVFASGVSPCSMLLLTENHTFLPVYVSGDDNDDDSSPDVTFGSSFVPEFGEYPQSNIHNFLTSIDPQSGSLAYVVTYENIDDYHISILYYHGTGNNETMKKVEIPMPDKSYPNTVASIHVFDTAVYLGTGGTVGWVNFGDSSHPPKYQELIRRSLSFKEYDLFAHEGNFLVAVDDVIMPIYADSFLLQGSQHVHVHKRDFELPGGINLRYKRTALIGDFLILLGSYGACYGHCFGQLLRRFDLKNNTYEEIIEHHEVSQKWDSSNFNIDGGLDWVDIAVTQRGEVAVAALDRGLCVIPPGPFTTLPPFFQTVDLGGRVRAVNTCGSATWALVENNNNDNNAESDSYHLVKLDSFWSELTKVAIPKRIASGLSQDKHSTVFLAG